jgi:HD-like signal output (HDOD) protein
MTPGTAVLRDPAHVIQHLATRSRFAAFSPVALRLMRLINEDASFSELARLITTDPSISTEVLRLSNSALFNLRAEVRSILHALAIIGRDRTEMIVFTACLWRYLPRPHGNETVRHCWRHSLASALLCEHVIDCGPRMDHVYTAALLHGIGQLALATEFPAQFQRVLQVANEEGHAVQDLEEAAFGANAFQIAAGLFASWRLPDDLTECATSLGVSGLGVSGLGVTGLGVTGLGVSAKNRETAAIVRAGCYIADKLGFSVCTHGSHQRLDRTEESPHVRRLLGLPWLLDVVAEQVNKVESNLTQV